MADNDRCELHEAAIRGEPKSSETFLQLARSPIGDECQICPVCRTARVFVGLRLAEESGYTFPNGEGSDAAWQALQGAIGTVRTKVHARG